MKKFRWVFIVLYFGLFIAFGVLFYYKYLDQFLKSGAAPVEKTLTHNSGNIYYSLDSNLYRVNPDLILDSESADRITRIQSTGEVNSLELSPSTTSYVYASKSANGPSEIWLVDSASNFSQNITSKNADELASFENFSRPKFNQNGTKIAFLAQIGNVDSIFIYNISDKTFQKLNFPPVSIADYTWIDTDKIVYCTKNNVLNGCYADTNPSSLFSAEASQINFLSKDKFIYLAKINGAKNIFVWENNSNLAVSDITLPNNVESYSLNSNNDQIAYSVGDNLKSNIYFSSIVGSNKIQLTLDNISFQGQISNTGDEISFFKPGQGLFAIKSNGSNLRKIINLNQTMLKLLTWR